MKISISKAVSWLMLSVILMIYMCDVRATSLADRSLDELFEVSVALLSIKVSSEKSECTESKCIYRSDIEVRETIKGDLAASRISICSLYPLGVQKIYYIFLVRGAAEDTYGMRCDYVALADGIIKDDLDETYYRYMSPNAYGRLVDFEGATYRTSEIEDPVFARKLSGWRLLSKMPKGAASKK